MKFSKLKQILPSIVFPPLLIFAFIQLINQQIVKTLETQIYYEYKVYLMNSAAFSKMEIYFKDLMVIGLFYLIVYYVFLYTDITSEQDTSIHMFMMSRFKNVSHYWLYLFSKYLKNSLIISMGYGAILVIISNTQQVRFNLSPNVLFELLLQGIKISLLMVLLKLFYNFINITTKNGSKSIYKLFTLFIWLITDIFIGRYHWIVMPDTYDINLRYISIYVCLIVMTLILYWSYSKKIGEYYD